MNLIRYTSEVGSRTSPNQSAELIQECDVRWRSILINSAHSSKNCSRNITNNITTKLNLCSQSSTQQIYSVRFWMYYVSHRENEMRGSTPEKKLRAGPLGERAEVDPNVSEEDVRVFSTQVASSCDNKVDLMQPYRQCLLTWRQTCHWNLLQNMTGTSRKLVTRRLRVSDECEAYTLCLDETVNTINFAMILVNVVNRVQRTSDDIWLGERWI